MSAVMEMVEAGTPFVQFEIRAIEDRNASIAAGHAVYKDVEFVKITPPGGNLVHEVAVTDQHRERFEKQYDAWKRGVEIPVDGTSIRMWPPATPSVVEMCIAARIRTVEELAEANSNALTRIGMGAQALKEKAAAWLKEAETRGVIAEENADLKLQLNEQAVAIDELRAELARLTADNPAKRGPGRPRKEG